MRADRLTAERERSLRRDRDLATDQFETADAELRRAHQRQAAACAGQVWYDQSEHMRRLDQALADFPDGPQLSPGAAERVAGLVERIAAGKTRITDADAEIAKQEKIIADNPVDVQAEPLMAKLRQLDQLTIDGAPLMGRATTAQVDLAHRIKDQKDLSGEIGAALKFLRVPDALPATVALKLDELEELADAVQDCSTAKLSMEAAHQAVKTARAQQGEAPAEPQDLTALRAAFDVWKGVADISVLETDHGQALARLTKAAAGLPKSWEGLIAAGIPAPETLDDLARRWASLTADLSSARKDLDVRAAELAEAKADLAALEAAPDAVDFITTEETRRRRDTEWQQHRARLTTETADQFEAAMYADDSTRAHYLTGAEARQRLLAAQNQKWTAEARHETASSHHSELITQRDDLSKRCAGLAHALGLENDAAPSSFSARHQALAAAADAAADLSNAKNALEALVAKQKSAGEALADAARPAGIDLAQGNLPMQVQHMLTFEDSVREVWAKWQKSENAIAELESASEQCAAKNKVAQDTLNRLTTALPLPDCTLDGIRAALPYLRRLQQDYDAHQKLSERIDALNQAIAALEQGAYRLAGILDKAEQETDIDPVQVIDRARARVDVSIRVDERRVEAMERRDEAERAKGRANADLGAAKEDLAGCFESQGGTDLEPPARVAELVERDCLRAERETADREMQRARAGVDTELFAEELDRLPDTTRTTELEQAMKDAQISRDTVRDAQREAERLYREAFEAVERSDLATEQATLREELRSGARHAAVARLGVLAAGGALRRLAAERRRSMLRDVEEAFVAMTTPAWTGVDVWSQAEGEKLVGILPTGDTVPVEQMSTGTMGQLYFALRLAGYRSFARKPGPLPMILDDIMETFDDDRARAALRLCAEIGESGQAILFTHHAHLVELAKKAIKGVAVIEMPLS